MSDNVNGYCGGNGMKGGSILHGLAETYSLMAYSFSLLDVDNTGLIDVRSGESCVPLQKALIDAGLEHLWTIVVNLAANGDSLTIEQFTDVFLSWMGISDNTIWCGAHREDEVPVSDSSHGTLYLN
jgi:hypothetical protein